MALREFNAVEYVRTTGTRVPMPAGCVREIIRPVLDVIGSLGVKRYGIDAIIAGIQNHLISIKVKKD